MRGLSLVAVSRGYSIAVCGLLIEVTSLCRGARALGRESLSSCGSRALERRLTNSAQA